MKRSIVVVAVLLIALTACTTTRAQAPASDARPLVINWEKNMLTIAGPHLAGPVSIHYLEAYCRPGSTDRDWRETVIPHQAKLVSVSDDGRTIRLQDTLQDGVVVDHVITAGHDEVDFKLRAHNPTDVASQAHWAQPCIRVDQFTGCSRDDARVEVPQYARQCFLFIDDKLARLPTQPWATEARYIPGQVYCPAHVDRNDVNPRPLSELVPSNGLCGCFSADGKQIMAVAWEPYQEVFQGVITCIHNDFRLGGLKPGETKHVRGKIYFVDNDVPALLARFHHDFPEQSAGNRGQGIRD